MSLYYEAADLLTGPSNAGGSLKSRIFSKKELKSQPAQIYALAIETCKWSSVLKEIIEKAELLRLERKVTPILSLLLVHDLLLAKRGIALPATHGLRASIERHKARLQAEFTKARIRRKLSTVEAFKAHVESGLENSSDASERPHPRWVRINSLKTTLEEQLDNTFSEFERVMSVNEVRERGTRRLFIDTNIPNVVAITPTIDLSKSEAYKSGAIIFQDKASCFPAYLLDPLPQDGDIIDTCSAPGNKTTHIAAILISHNSEPDECSQVIHAFEKNKGRAETLEKMVNVAGSGHWTKLHPGQDFLKTDPNSSTFKNVGALLLDPSCSGSGIIGRDEMPELHLPVLKEAEKTGSKPPKKGGKSAAAAKEETRKRKREDNPGSLEVMVDDDGEVTAVNSEEELKTRLEALSKFQLELLLHALKFPAAQKITYSTCSVHVQENENVVRKALEDPVAIERGWRIQKRSEQIRGMREWSVRGLRKDCNGDDEFADACIRANKDDENGTMGFFLAGFVRDQALAALDADFLRDEHGHLVRDVMGIPTRVQDLDETVLPHEETTATIRVSDKVAEQDDDEWAGFEDETAGDLESKSEKPIQAPKHHKEKKESFNPSKKRPQLGIKPDQKRRRK